MRTRWGLDIILIQATEGTENHREMQKRSVYSVYSVPSVVLYIAQVIYFNSHTHQRQHPPPPGVAARIAEHPGAGISI